jgi:SEC-C motif-containing protein
MKLAVNQACPCGSERKAKSCCAPLLSGMIAASPEALMRSRYTAYVAGAYHHIVRTTHPSSPHVQTDRARWLEEIAAFCGSTEFVDLQIHSTDSQGKRGWVRFTASLIVNGTEHPMREHSLFLFDGGRWRYHSGEPHQDQLDGASPAKIS